MFPSPFLPPGPSNTASLLPALCMHRLLTMAIVMVGAGVMATPHHQQQRQQYFREYTPEEGAPPYLGTAMTSEERRVFLDVTAREATTSELSQHHSVFNIQPGSHYLVGFHLQPEGSSSTSSGGGGSGGASATMPPVVASYSEFMPPPQGDQLEQCIRIMYFHAASVGQGMGVELEEQLRQELANALVHLVVENRYNKGFNGVRCYATASTESQYHTCTYIDRALEKVSRKANVIRADDGHIEIKRKLEDDGGNTI